MDGNNGKVLSAEQILNRKQAAYFAAIMKEDIENKYSQEASFSSFDTKVMNIVDDIQDAMADIKMDPKTGKILNAPGSQISVSEDGELEVPDNEVQINTESNFTVPHQVSGKLIAKLGGEERTTFNQLSKDGLNYNEKAYIGKELNYEFLLKKAKMGNFEQEVERARERIQFYKNNIDPKKDVKNKEMFEDKVNCTVILATAAYMKYTLKVPVSDDASAKKALAICTKKENVTAMKNKIEKMSGKDIIEAAEDGTLIGLPKQIKQPEVKGLQVNK